MLRRTLIYKIITNGTLKELNCSLHFIILASFCLLTKKQEHTYMCHLNLRDDSLLKFLRTWVRNNLSSIKLPYKTRLSSHLYIILVILLVDMKLNRHP